jgi:carboxylesterase type B
MIMESSRKVLVNLVVWFLLVKFISSEVLMNEDGSIEGSVLLDRRNQPFHAFRKIPYAEPPVGEDRFKAPKSKTPWTNVLDCSQYGPMCAQNDLWNGMIPIDEDCLFLNVFTKNLPSVENNELKPVIAFLHGGGFELGSSIEYGPEYLMERK